MEQISQKKRKKERGPELFRSSYPILSKNSKTFNFQTTAVDLFSAFKIRKATQWQTCPCPNIMKQLIYRKSFHSFYLHFAKRPNLFIYSFFTELHIQFYVKCSI